MENNKKGLHKVKFICKKHSAAIFCGLCLLCVFLFLLKNLMPITAPLKGHDAEFHYLRVDALKYNIENNNLFSGIDYLFFNGGGYAGFAYPTLFLYIPALFRVIGLGIGDSMALFILLCSVFSYFTMFLFAKRVSKSPICGTICAVVYVLSTYRQDLYITRFALGELQAYMFWPLILYGLYDFIFCDFKKPHLLGLGFVGMILSHTISTALALGFCVIFSLVFARRILKKPKKLVKLSGTVCCVALATAYYWMPLLELLSSCEMAVKVNAYDTENSVIKPSALFVFNADGVSGMGFPIFLMLVPRLFLTRRSPVAKKYLYDKSTGKRKDILIAADTFAIIGSVCAILTTDLVPWELLSKVLNFMQFPWRLFAPASVLLIAAGTIYLYYIVKYTKTQKLAVVIVTAAALGVAAIHADISGINHSAKRPSNYYLADSDRTYNVGQGEWLPLAARADYGVGLDDLQRMDGYVEPDYGALMDCERNNGTLTFDADENPSAEYVILPYIWYKGYEATDENGSELEVTMSENGLVQVDLQNANGTVTVKHKPTAVRIEGYCVTGISVAAMLALFVILRLRASSQSSRPEKPAAKSEEI